MQRKGISNVVLMLGIALSMGILLVGGFLLVVKFTEAQARAAPELLATELVSLINTVQTAPETVTFEYFTESGADDFPVIGSLEIDDDKSLLCVHPKTEDEIFNTITEKAAVGAGFGATGYSYARTRSEAARRAAAKPVLIGSTITNRLGGATIDSQLTAKIGDNTAVGKALTKQLSGERLSKAEGKLVQKYFKNNPHLKKDWRVLQRLTEKDPVLRNIFKASRITTFTDKVIQKLIPKKLSLLGARLKAYFARIGEIGVVKRIGGTLQKVNVLRGKLPGKLAIGFVAATYLLTGGDWEQTMSAVSFVVVGKYAPTLITRLLQTRIAAGFVQRLVAVVPASVASGTAYKISAECATKPTPAAPACAIAAAIAKATEVMVNIAFSIYNTYLLDVWLFQIYDAAGDAVKQERAQLACKNFVPPKEKVLLTPPNCVPKVSFGKDLEAWRPALIAEFGASTAILTTATAWAASTAFIPSVGLIPQLQFYGATTLAVGVPIGTLALRVSQAPTDIIPRASCDPTPGYETCDRTYLRQDCPNWFISDPGGGSAAAGGSFVGILQGGPGCAALGLLGSAGFLCDATRVSAALLVFVSAPGEVFNFMLQGYTVGLNKQSIGAKSALGLGPEFSDNVGFWYAELPFTIEINRIYINSTESQLVIRKV